VSFNPLDLFEPDPTKPIASSKPKPYKWLIIDGGGLVTTAWASHRKLDRPEDRVRAGIYVFIVCLASLCRLVDDGAKVIVCWDGHDNRAFRRGIHPWYKHGRGSVINRPEVRVIMKELSPLLTSMGVAQVMVDGCEADDMVATISREVACHDQTCLIFSDDKDYLQLVDEHIHLMRRSLRGIILTPDQCALLGILYGQEYLNVKAIAGDGGDNIRGLIGIGEAKGLKAMKTIPDLIDTAREEPDLVDWEDLDRNLYRAFVRAGRKLVSPLNPKNCTFAKEFARKHGLPIPGDIDVPDKISLRHAGLEIVKCYNLVEMCDTMDYGELKFPQVNLANIPAALRRLELDHEDDLYSSIYRLAGLRNPSLLTARNTVERAGSALDDEIVPEDMF
jgi:DNA polymerase-1